MKGYLQQKVYSLQKIPADIRRRYSVLLTSFASWDRTANKLVGLYSSRSYFLGMNIDQEIIQLSTTVLCKKLKNRSRKIET